MKKQAKAEHSEAVPRAVGPGVTPALKPWALAALVFGLLTLVSGGRALFGGEQARASMGAVVDFVLWFNFLAGVAYLAAALALWRNCRWALPLAATLAGGTALVALGLGWHIAQGGAYEYRTLGAMTLRLGFWLAVVLVLRRAQRFIK